MQLINKIYRSRKKLIKQQQPEAADIVIHLGSDQYLEEQIKNKLGVKDPNRIEKLKTQLKNILCSKPTSKCK